MLRFLSFTESVCYFSILDKSTAASSDLFAHPRQAVWSSPPLSFLAPEINPESPFGLGSRPSVFEVLKELQVMTRCLCQLVKMAGFLLTVSKLRFGSIINSNSGVA